MALMQLNCRGLIFYILHSPSRSMTLSRNFSVELSLASSLGWVLVSLNIELIFIISISQVGLGVCMPVFQ